MRKALLAVSLVVGLSLLAQAATAQARRGTRQQSQQQTQQWQFGPEVNFATNNVGPGIGGRAVFAGLGNAVNVPGLEAYASFDYFFPSSGYSVGSSPSLWEINVNGTWDIPNMTGGFKPYVGAGLGYDHWSAGSYQILGVTYSASGSSTGLNLLGGTHFKPTPKLNMFGEIRVELHTGTAVVFTVGLLF